MALFRIEDQYGCGPWTSSRETGRSIVDKMFMNPYYRNIDFNIQEPCYDPLLCSYYRDSSYFYACTEKQFIKWITVPISRAIFEVGGLVKKLEIDNYILGTEQCIFKKADVKSETVYKTFREYHDAMNYRKYRKQEYESRIS